MVKSMDKVLTVLHSMNTEGTLTIISLIHMVTLHTKMGINLKGRLKMGNGMVMGPIHGLMDLIIKDLINMTKNKVRENINLSNRLIGKVNG